MNRDAASDLASPLVWMQPKPFNRLYELRSGDSLIGQLRFSSLCGSLASAEIRSESWTFKRVGFLAPRVTVRAGDSGSDLAIFRPYWGGGGVLDLGDGVQFLWQCTNFWRSKWAFVRSDNRPVVHFSNHGLYSSASAQLEVAPSSLDLPEFFLLVALGWYLVILAADDAAVIGLTTSVVS